MKTVTVSEAKAKLSAILRRVARGDVVVISSRGRPVARISAVTAAEAGSDEERLAWLESQGLIKRGSGQLDLDKFHKLPRPTLPPGSTLLEAILEEREEGR